MTCLFLPVASMETGKSVLGLSHHSVLEGDGWFLASQVRGWKESFPKHGSYPPSPPLPTVTAMPHVDDSEVEIWDLQVMLGWVKTRGDAGTGRNHLAQGREVNIYYLAGDVILYYSVTQSFTKFLNFPMGTSELA